MIGLDTNILLRAVLDDDPNQSPAARRLLRSLSGTQPGLVNVSVLMEFYWVLRTRYRLKRERLAGAMRNLLEVEHLTIEAFEAVGMALALYEDRHVDFSDAVIALRNVELGAQTTVTFDEAAATRIPSMELLA